MGGQCGMRFLDSDVRKPLAAVTAMNDEGNTVVFSRKWGKLRGERRLGGEDHDGEGWRHVRGGSDDEEVAGGNAEGSEVGRRRWEEGDE